MVGGDRIRLGQRLQFYIESRPLRLDDMLAESREEIEAVAGPIASEGAMAMDPVAPVSVRLHAAMEQSATRGVDYLLRKFAPPRCGGSSPLAAWLATVRGAPLS